MYVFVKTDTAKFYLDKKDDKSAMVTVNMIYSYDKWYLCHQSKKKGEKMKWNKKKIKNKNEGYEKYDEYVKKHNKDIKKKKGAIMLCNNSMVVR